MPHRHFPTSHDDSENAPTISNKYCQRFKTLHDWLAEVSPRRAVQDEMRLDVKSFTCNIKKCYRQLRSGLSYMRGRTALENYCKM